MKVFVPNRAGLVFTFVSGLVFVFFISCSSAPKKPLEVFTERNTATNQLDLANQTANQGRYSDALLILEDARRLAVSVDDPSLLVRTLITRGNILFSLGRHDEAFQDWEAARKEADYSGENDLSVLARIYSVRGSLVGLINSRTKAGVKEIRDQADSLTASVESDLLARAAGFVVLGMAEKELERYTEAEAALRKALDIHEKNRYLEEAAYDWYFLGSIFSVAGNYDDALAALETAIGFDRRAENGFGLAASWQAMGEVYQRKNLAAESGAAFKRAADIYRALGFEEAAASAAAKAGTADK